MPTMVEQEVIKFFYYETHGITGIFGQIDGTHVTIVSPMGESSELFRKYVPVEKFKS